MTHTRTALVIGGGIAGPVAAMALQKAGIEATVYEAYEHTADGIGGGLSIAPNGLGALAVLGIGDAIMRIGTPITAMVMQSWTSKRLAEFSPPPDLPAMQFVWRDELYRTLFDEMAGRGIRAVRGKRLVGAQTTDHGVTAQCDDGTQASADILIGADGIRSTVRAVIDPAAPHPRYTGLLGFGAEMD
ncbi:MAG: FAD-dependent oxidoreductase, partial [Pseudonocardiaceae bacterium]